MVEKWLAGAIKKPGVFTKYVHDKYGNRAFTKRGTIKIGYINKIIKDPKTSSITLKRARLAKTLKRIGKK